MPQLVQAVIEKLPVRFYCHYQKALEPLFLASYSRIFHVHALKMDFQGLPSDLSVAGNQPCIPLTMEDLQPLQQLLQIASPNNAFHPRMLATGNFFGIKQEKQLLSVAGVHIYAPTYRIAVLGNIATHPSMRRRGLATQCMTALLKALEPDVDFIGLITRADNTQAIALYNRTGFSIASTLEEALFEKR
jgi:GNAT superfamily N-acetyltransferase